MTTNTLRAYCNQIAQIRATQQATEHSYRPVFASLIETLGGNQVRALNEPSHIACGAPDFIVERNGVPTGHVECKDVGVNLDDVENDEQLRRYRDGLPNLILTNYLEFRWYTEGQLRETARLGRFDGQNRMTFDRAGAGQVGTLFDGFFAADLPTINNPRELAERLAAKARLLRDGVERILRQEARSGPLHGLLSAYQEALIQNLTAAEFADLQAQTAAYGLFAARCQHEPSKPFTRKEAIFAKTTPFLRDVFGRIAGPDIDPRIAWIVDDLARLLDRADMAAILTDFGRRTRQEDPVVHFYEDFLAAYDPKLREVRGVYYTPEPVVSYIVRSVDHLLRGRFGLADGLADTATVTVERPDGEPETGPRVLILDPAAGTGTFLREAITTIRTTIENKGLGGAWPDYVRDHLLPRLFGFELLMAPYAICHLKLALEIGGREGDFTMPAGERLRVFLTNTLEEPHERTGALFAHEIVREAAGADDVKRTKPVMVVLGNPPYSGHSANKGAWIAELIDDYKRAFPELQKPAQAKWLSDDYVKFIRFAQWRIERTGEGVLAFVTNHGWLDNPTFRGMRHSLMETFDEVHVLDLHGNAKKKERAPDGGRDDNVFDIQQGVAIGLFVKHADTADKPARVFHADVWGEREAGPDGGKYGWLAANSIETTAWIELAPKSPLYLFIQRDEELLEEYEAGWSIPVIFSPNGDPAPGIVTTHDQFAISWTPEEAAAKVERLLATTSEDEARSQWRLCSQKQWQYGRAKRELADGAWRERIEPILYRPFDIRTTVFDGNVAVHRRERVMRHMLAGKNLGHCHNALKRDSWGMGIRYSLASTISFSAHKVSLKAYDINYHVFSLRLPKRIWPRTQYRPGLHRNPLYHYRPRLHPGRHGGPRNHVRAGRRLPLRLRHPAQPRIPPPVRRFPQGGLPAHPADQRPRAIRQTRYPRQAACRLAPHGNGRRDYASLSGRRLQPRMEKVRYAPPNDSLPGRVWINRDQYFEGVAPAAWAFAIGGYRPAEKWLKDRKARVLSYDDITHYRNICAALAETPDLMARIDALVTLHGGWPLTRHE